MQKKAKDFGKHVGKVFVEEVKNEVKSMVESELKEYAENPRAYAKKVSIEAAKFAASPTKYGTQVVIKVGVKAAVNTAVKIGGEAKDDFLTQKYKQENPYKSTMIEASFYTVDKHKDKVSDYLIKKSRFKETSMKLKRRKALVKVKENAQTITKLSTLSEKISWYTENRIIGILSNKLTALNYKKDMSEHNKQLNEIYEKVKKILKPFISKFICGLIVELITSFFGVGAVLKFFFMARQIIDVVKDVYTAYNEKDFVRKWGTFGKAIGKGIAMFTQPGNGACNRRFKKFRKNFTK